MGTFLVLLGAAAVAVVLYRGRKKRSRLLGDAQPVARMKLKQPLTMTQDGDWIVIAARPSPAPSREGAASVLAALPLGIFLFSLGYPGWGLFIWLAISGVALAFFSARNRNVRQAMLPTFAVKHDAIRLPNGTVIPQERLYRIVVKNTQSKQVILVGTSTMGQFGALAAHSAHQRLEAISNAVALEHDGTLSYLAGGLTPELAHAVMTETIRRVDAFGASA